MAMPFALCSMPSAFYPVPRAFKLCFLASCHLPSTLHYFSEADYRHPKSSIQHPVYSIKNQASNILLSALSYQLSAGIQGASALLKLRYQLLHGGLGVSEQHAGIFLDKERVVNTGKTGGH